MGSSNDRNRSLCSPKCLVGKAAREAASFADWGGNYLVILGVDSLNESDVFLGDCTGFELRPHRAVELAIEAYEDGAGSVLIHPVAQFW